MKKSANKKVLIIVENSYVPLDVRVWNEATSLRDEGWLVTVICPEMNFSGSEEIQPVNLYTAENFEGVQVYRFPLKTAETGVLNYLLEYLTAFISIAKLSWHVWNTLNFDIIHLCNPPDIFFPIALFYRWLGARVIFDHHDLFPEFITWRYKGLRGKLLFLASRLTEYFTFRVSNIVISTNHSYREIALDRGHVNPDHIFVVRNGPNKNKFLPIEADTSLKCGFPYLACYAGVMGFEDGVMELLDSIHYLIKVLGRHDVLFTLLGDGSVRKTALNKVSEYGLDDFVIMPGMVFYKVKLRTYLSTAEVLLSPEPMTPLNRHSTFIKVAEYMMMSKPIVAYDLPETRFTAGESALYVQPGDVEGFGRAINSLLNSPEQRKLMGEIGQKRVNEGLSWEDQKIELLHAYEMAMT